MDTGDVFNMSTIFTKLNNQELQRLFLVSGLHNNILFENLNIIFLHSLNMNTDIEFNDKNNYDKMFNEIYNLFLNGDPPNIPYSFIDTLNILNIIIQTNQKAYYLFMNLIFEASDETFKNQIIEYIKNDSIPIEGKQPIIFSQEFPLIYKNAKLLFIVSNNPTDEEKKEMTIIETDYFKYQIDSLDKINEDYNEIFKQINNIATINNPDNDFLNKHPYFFRINTPNWTKFVRKYQISQEMYETDYRRINYFISMIIDNISFIPICTKLLSESGAEFCNLKYLDNYNVTPLMYACGYSIDNLDEYILHSNSNVPHIEEYEEDEDYDDDDEDDDDDVTTTLMTDLTVDEIVPILLRQRELTTPNDRAHNNRIFALKKLFVKIPSETFTWDAWYSNPNIPMTYKDAMINLFDLIYDYYEYYGYDDDDDDDEYNPLTIVDDMPSMIEFAGLLNYSYQADNMDFKFHIRINPDNNKIETVAMTYIMRGDERYDRLEQLYIDDKNEWTVYKLCILVTKAHDEEDLKKQIKHYIKDILKEDDNNKLVCVRYDPDNTSNVYTRYVEDILRFNDIKSPITSDFIANFNEVFAIYDTISDKVPYAHVERFLNINQFGGSEPQQPEHDDDILPSDTPQLIRSEAIIPTHRENVPLNGEDNNQPRQSAGATPEQLIQFQMLALKMVSYGAHACNLAQQNNKGFRAYNYAVKHRLLDVVYEMDKLLYTNTNLYDTIKSINVPHTTIVNDYIYSDDIDINEIDKYFAENTDKVVFKYNDNYTIIHLDQIKPNIIDAKRYTCNDTSNVIYRPPDTMIDRINPIFHADKIGNMPIGGGVLFKDIISIDTNMSRFYELEDTNTSYISFVSSVLVDSAATENVVSMTHCNPGATGKIYRLVPLELNITQGGSLKIKYIRKKSQKKSLKRKSSKRRYKRN
jgi:hypothetical protein